MAIAVDNLSTGEDEDEDGGKEEEGAESVSINLQYIKKRGKIQNNFTCLYLFCERQAERSAALCPLLLALLICNTVIY